MRIYVSIIVYALRLFIVFFNKICLCLPNCLSMCVPSFVLIYRCVSELYSIYVPIVMYGLIVVLHCLPNFLLVVIIWDVGFCHFIRFRCCTPSGFLDN